MSDSTLPTVRGYRNESIDIARGLGIALVVLGHNQLVLRGGDSGFLFRTIYSFHVPLFFFLSGLFVKPEQSWGRLIVGKADALLKPYFVVLLSLGICLAAARFWKGDFSIAWLSNYGVGVLYGVGSSIAWTPLWFLPCLFIVYAVSYPLIQRQHSQWFGGIATAALFLLGAIVLGRTVALPWSFDLLPLCAAYFMAGYVLRMKVMGMNFQPVWAMLACAVFFFLNWRLTWVVNLNDRIYEAPLVSTLRAFLGIFVCLQTAACIVASGSRVARWLSIVGTGSLFILMFHGEFQGRLGHFVEKTTGVPMLASALGFVAGIVFPLILLHGILRLPSLSILLLPRRQSVIGRQMPNS